MHRATRGHVTDKVRTVWAHMMCGPAVHHPVLLHNGIKVHFELVINFLDRGSRFYEYMGVNSLFSIVCTRLFLLFLTILLLFLMAIRLDMSLLFTVVTC